MKPLKPMIFSVKIYRGHMDGKHFLPHDSWARTKFGANRAIYIYIERESVNIVCVCIYIYIYEIHSGYLTVWELEHRHCQ